MKYYGQREGNGKSVDQFLHEVYFPNKRNGFFIECGAWDGVNASNSKFFEDSMGWTGINIEPVPVHYEQLVVNRPNCLNLNFALSDTNGKSTFTQVTHPRMGQCCVGSLNHVKTQYDHLKKNNFGFYEIEVETLTYKSFCDLHMKNVDHIDLFILDVEGNEIKVLESMKGARVLPDIMCIEYGHIGLNNLIDRTKELGYRYDSKHFVNAHFVKE